ncbi:MAG: hypothetical protein NXI32_09265 [bacterium]|nr:hypothetical protein [bacterium]
MIVGVVLLLIIAAIAIGIAWHALREWEMDLEWAESLSKDLKEYRKVLEQRNQERAKVFDLTKEYNDLKEIHLATMVEVRRLHDQLAARQEVIDRVIDAIDESGILREQLELSDGEVQWDGNS